MSDTSLLLPALAVGCLALGGCATTAELRVHNASTLDFTEVSVSGVPYGDIAAGATSEYRSVGMKLWWYALVRLTADGHEVNAQTLNVGSRRFTHRIEVLDLAAGHLAVEVVRD